MAGQPKRFQSAEQLISLWSDFCNDIVVSEFNTVPTQTAFCRWLSENFKDTDRKTIYNALNEYFPDIKKNFEQLQSDIIMQGGMLGKYNPTMSIFGLKNWCGWGENGNSAYNRGSENKQEDDPLTKALKEEAERMQNAELSE